MKTVEPITGRQTGELARLLEERGIGKPEFQFLTQNPKLVVQLINGELVSLEQAKKILNGQETSPVARPDISIQYLIAKETDALSNFFGRDVDMSFYRQTLEGLKPEQISLWASLGLGIHCLPPTTLTRDLTFPGWQVKPGNFYWENLVVGNLYRMVDNDLVKVEAAVIPGQVLLIDHRLKPRYSDGKQRWSDDKDFLGGVIQQLRKDGLLARYEYGNQSSRFGVSADEVQNHVRPAVAELLGLNPDQVGLEPTLVANIIPQIHKDIPRAKDGKTDTWVWYDEYFESADRRVCGGDSGGGGLARVDWYYAARRRSSVAFRLQGVLGTQVLGT